MHMKNSKNILTVVIVVIVLVVSILILKDWSSIKTDSSLEGRVETISWNQVNIREKPSTTSQKLGTFQLGDTVTLTGKYVPGTGATALAEDNGWVETTQGWIVRSAIDW